MSGYTSRSAEDLADVTALAMDLRQSRIEPEFTMQVVRHETGIPADTLYAWERRYGFPKPGRTDTGQRRYSERDIVALRWLRDQTNNGLTISDALALLRRALEDEPPRENAPEPPPRPDSFLKCFRDDLLAGDPAEAQEDWDALALATSPDGLLADVIMPVWADATRADVDALAREQARSFLLRKVMVLLDQSAPDSGTRAAAILIGSLADATVPALALSCALSRAGYRIALPLLDATRANTLAFVSRLPPDTTVIHAGPESDGELLESYRMMHPDRRCLRWWPQVPSANDNGEWLPASLREVAAALAKPA